MTTYTVRWLDYALADPVRSETFDTLDEARGFVRAANQQAGVFPRKWLGLTVAMHDHFEAAGEDWFADGLRTEHSR
jgi:hypothetical protein